MRSRHPQEKLLNDFSLLCGSCGCGSGWIPLRLHLPDLLPVLQFTSAAKVEGFLPWKSWQGLYTDNTYETPRQTEFERLLSLCCVSPLSGFEITTGNEKINWSAANWESSWVRFEWMSGFRHPCKALQQSAGRRGRGRPDVGCSPPSSPPPSPPSSNTQMASFTSLQYICCAF